VCFSLLSGFPAHGLLPYIFYTAFFKWTGFIFSGVVDTVNTGTIVNAPVFKFIIYALAASVFMVHGATPPFLWN
jgi:hypothetical protein